MIFTMLYIGPRIPLPLLFMATLESDFRKFVGLLPLGIEAMPTR